MKKMKLIIAATALLGLVSSSAVYADGFAPGEGLYVGGFAASSTGIVQPKVSTSSTQSEDGRAGTFEATDGGLGMMGVEGGVYSGYGYKMGDFYAGLEGEAAWGDVEFKLTSSIGVKIGASEAAGSATQLTVTEVSAKKDWTSGLFGRVGYYINPNTLFSFKGGVLVSKFEVSYNGTNAQSESYYGGGPSFGMDLESKIAAIDPNLSLRIGAVYTNYLTAPVSGIGTNDSAGDSDVNNEITGQALSARVGIQYSFFDVNSLF